MNLPKDFKEFIELLNSNEVRYLLVGGYAVGYHGYPRPTGDIDFLVEPRGDNAAKIIRTLEEFGFGSVELKVEDFTSHNQVIQLGYPPNRIDIITSAAAVPFDEAWQERVEAEIDGMPVKLISKRLLIAN